MSHAHRNKNRRRAKERMSRRVRHVAISFSAGSKDIVAALDDISRKMDASGKSFSKFGRTYEDATTTEFASVIAALMKDKVVSNLDKPGQPFFSEDLEASIGA